MSEPYRCGKCGRNGFRVVTGFNGGKVMVVCGIQDPPRRGASCDHAAVESSLVAAFEAIARKPEEPINAPPQA